MKNKSIKNMKRNLIMTNTTPTKEEAAIFSEEQAALQEKYYWHVLMEFHAILKVFGNTKVLADLKKIKEQVDGVVEEPRIITL
ncbi:MAG: hypothetical protein NUV97_02685 [archaeon]|nr:hypothetical protein [archaeon]